MDGYRDDMTVTGLGDLEAGEGDRGRDSLFLLAQFRGGAGGQERSVRIRNLSAGGLMAELDTAPVDGSAVEVMVRGIGWIRGRVAWFAEGRAGIAFDQPIDPLLARKPVGRVAKGASAKH